MPKALMNVMKTRKCLMKGCQAYLAYVVDATKEKVSKEYIEAVKEHPKVFPEDLSGLALDRQVRFDIALAQGMTPIAKAPYQLAALELKELMTQKLCLSTVHHP